MKIKILCFLLSFISITVYSQNRKITVNINGFKSDKGKCLIYLYNDKTGFPTDTEKAIKTAYAGIIKGKSTIVLNNIADGEYAIAVIHDENDNGKLDKNFIGMPKEGVGVSNNARGHFGPPSYNDAKFQLNKELISNIIVKYL
jgi:uncharacterized protein (DUF2141 family)